MKPAEAYILNQKEPFKSILLQLQILIEAAVPDLELQYKWKIPYYYYKNKPFCYLNVTKKYVDVGFRFNPKLLDFDNYLISENRKLFKSLRYTSIDEINQEILFSVLLALKKNDK